VGEDELDARRRQGADDVEVGTATRDAEGDPRATPGDGLRDGRRELRCTS
jgi:hypothetical protein